MASNVIEFNPGSSTAPTTRIELTISARNIIDADVFSKSDPMCVLYIWESGCSCWKEFGRTETIDNTLNPDFVKKFLLDYFFEECQKLKFELYDIDSSSRRLEEHDYLGQVECNLSEIVCRKTLKREIRCKKRVNCGHILVSAEELSTCKDLLTFKFAGKKLARSSFFGSSKPFLAIYKVTEDSKYIVCHKTEYVVGTKNPYWKPFSISSVDLCNGDYDRLLKIECYDYHSNGSHKYFGAFLTSINKLQSSTSGTSFPLVNEKKNQEIFGYIELMHCSVEKRSSFLEYIQGGLDLNCTIAIDFTASNGNPRQQGTLHYIDPVAPNQYAVALKAVGEIIQDYDSDKLFPVFGFGARVPPNGVISHNFYVNGQSSNPYCEGISGVLAAYQRCIATVQLSGPTNFAPIVNLVASIAKRTTDGSKYFILLMLTDGIITDMPFTKEAIVKASHLPLSIIIVGIGEADFDAMEELDGDEIRLSYDGRQAVRDIVQFVPIRNFLQRNRYGDISISQDRLSKEVLAEIPDQIESYMWSRNILPNPPSTPQPTSLKPGPPPAYSSVM